MPKLLERSTSSEADRVRTSFFLILVKIGDSRELHICWKYVDGSVGFFSTSANRSKSRPAWGSVIGCKFKHDLNKEKTEYFDYFIFENRGHDKKAFKNKEMNPTLWQINSFIDMVQLMRRDKKLQLLALYLGLLPKSKNFSQNQEGVHDQDGFRLDKTGVKEEDLVAKQGNLEEYREFVEKATESCMDVNNMTEAMGNVEGGKKRKSAGDGDIEVSIVKKSKAEQLKEAKELEITGKDGLEKSYIDTYIGRADVPLENLINSPKVKFPVNPFKVEGLARQIAERHDPALLCLTVCPAEGEPFNTLDLSSNKYEVIHGRHRVLALQKLDQQGLLTQKVPTMGKKMVTCYIVRTDIVQANYASLRGNDVQSDYVRKPFLHELIYILEGLREHYSNDKALETVLRFGKTLSFGHDDLTALKKVGGWPSASLTKLSQIVKLFESLQTEDAKYLAKRHCSKIMEGTSIPVPHNLFKRIAKMTAEYFDSVAGKIIRKELSLKDASENFGKLSSRNVTLATVVKQMSDSGHHDVQDICRAYPGKFGDEVLDSFAGAVIGGKGINNKGIALKDYCQDVIANKENIIPKVTLKEKIFEEVDLSAFTGVETVVVNCKKLTDDQVKQVKMLKTLKISTNLVILFSEQEEKMEAFNKLKGDLGNLKEIFFETESPVSRGDFCQNLKHGIVSAPLVFKPPLKSFNGPLSNLENVVNQITPPGGRCVFINEGNLVLSAIHATFGCEYYGQRSALEQFDKKLRAGTEVVRNFDEISNENNGEYIQLGSDNVGGEHDFTVIEGENSETGGLMTKVSGLVEVTKETENSISETPVGGEHDFAVIEEENSVTSGTMAKVSGLVEVSKEAEDSISETPLRKTTEDKDMVSIEDKMYVG